MSKLTVDKRQGVLVTVGDRVAALMESRGWTLGQLSERSHLDKSYLSKLRRGKYASPGQDVLTKLASAFSITVGD